MKSNLARLYASLLIVGIGSVSALAQIFPFDFYFDEDGNGVFFDTAGNQFVNQGYMAFDQTGGVNGLCLTYDLPSFVGNGDVGFLEPGTSDISDVFRFWDGNGTSHLNFYSDNSDGADSLADVGIPVNFNGALLNETFDAQGNEVCILDTGWPNNNRYTGLSDVVPEPASMVALGLGLAAIVRKRRNRN